MLILVKNLENTIWVEPSAAIDIGGFQATLALCGVVKTITDLTVSHPKFTFSAAESNRCGKGVYGELKVMDSSGKLYLKYLPQFTLVENEEDYKAVGKQKLVLSIATTYHDHLSQGSTPAPTEGATVEQVHQIVNQTVEQAVNNIGQTVIQTQPVTVVNQEGQPITMTVQEAVQTVHEMQTKVEQAAETHLAGGIVDEDGDGQPDDGTLYLNPMHG